MDVMEIAAKMLADKLGLDASATASGLQSLFGGDGLDVSKVVSLLQQGDLKEIVGSWLGDGANMNIDPAAIVKALGADKIESAAGIMNTSSDNLAGGLSDVLPALIDKSSSGGNLLDTLGGAEGIASLAKKFF